MPANRQLKQNALNVLHLDALHAAVTYISVTQANFNNKDATDLCIPSRELKRDKSNLIY